MSTYIPSISTGLHIKPYTHKCDTRQAVILNPSSNLAISSHKKSIILFGCQRFIHLISHEMQRNNRSNNRNFAVYNSVQPGVPLPSCSGPPSSGSWKGWIVGMVLTFVLPFLTNKWGPLLKIKNEVVAAVDTVEFVVDAIEKVAEEVEKVAEDIADDLPDGKLKNALTFIENVADRIDDAAEVIGDVIDKVQEVEEQVESAVESALNEKKVAVLDEAKKY